jgi:predicted small integral membrane protein
VLTIRLAGYICAFYDSAYIINADDSSPDDRYVLLAQIISDVNRTLCTAMLVILHPVARLVSVGLLQMMRNRTLNARASKKAHIFVAH